MSAPDADIRKTIAASIGAAIPSVSENLASRLDQVELLIEQMGKSTEYIQSFNEYVLALKHEIIVLRWIRYFAVGLTTVFIVLTFGVLICIMFFHKTWFWTLGQYDRGALIISSLAACVVLLSILLKGAFRSLGDSTHGDLLPENLKIFYDVAKDQVPKG